MNYANAYQSEIVARQRTTTAAFAAREHTRRHGVAEVEQTHRRPHRFHITWHPVRTAHT